MTGSRDLPGFSAEQSFAIEVVIERAVSKGVAAGIKSYQDSNCKEHEARTEHLEMVLFGRREIGVIGMDEQLAINTKTIKSMTSYLTWLKVTLTASMLSLVVGLVALVLGK